VRPKIDHREQVRSDSIQEITVDGVSVFAFTVKPGDVQEWDLAEGNAGGNKQPNERAEISYAPAPDSQKATSPANVREGMTQTYDVDYRFKSGFPSHVSARHEWAVLTQFHPQPNAKGIPGFSGATFHDGQITFENPNGDGSYFAKVLGTPDSWFRLRMAVKWSAGKDGYAVVQDRMTKQIIGRYDGPTIAPGEFKYVKQGYYRAGGLPEGTVYQTLLEVNEGDLTMAAMPTDTGKADTGATAPAAVTSSAPAPAAPATAATTAPSGDFATAHPKAEAGRLQLVGQRPALEAVLLQLDAAIETLQEQRKEIQKQRDATVTVLNAGAWT
jgi:hypothetical protein